MKSLVNKKFSTKNILPINFNKSKIKINSNQTTERSNKKVYKTNENISDKFYMLFKNNSKSNQLLIKSLLSNFSNLKNSSHSFQKQDFILKRLNLLEKSLLPSYLQVKDNINYNCERLYLLRNDKSKGTAIGLTKQYIKNESIYSIESLFDEEILNDDEKKASFCIESLIANECWTEFDSFIIKIIKRLIQTGNSTTNFPMKKIINSSHTDLLINKEETVVSIDNFLRHICLLLITDNNDELQKIDTSRILKLSIKEREKRLKIEQPENDLLFSILRLIGKSSSSIKEMFDTELLSKAISIFSYKPNIISMAIELNHDLNKENFLFFLLIEIQNIANSELIPFGFNHVLTTKFYLEEIDNISNKVKLINNDDVHFLFELIRMNSLHNIELDFLNMLKNRFSQSSSTSITSEVYLINKIIFLLREYKHSNEKNEIENELNEFSQILNDSNKDIKKRGMKLSSSNISNKPQLTSLQYPLDMILLTMIKSVLNPSFEFKEFYNKILQFHNKQIEEDENLVKSIRSRIEFNINEEINDGAEDRNRHNLYKIDNIIKKQREAVLDYVKNKTCFEKESTNEMISKISSVIISSSNNKENNKEKNELIDEVMRVLSEAEKNYLKEEKMIGKNEFLENLKNNLIIAYYSESLNERYIESIFQNITEQVKGIKSINMNNIFTIQIDDRHKEEIINIINSKVNKSFSHANKLLLDYFLNIQTVNTRYINNIDLEQDHIANSIRKISKEKDLVDNNKSTMKLDSTLYKIKDEVKTCIDNQDNSSLINHILNIKDLVKSIFKIKNRFISKSISSDKDILNYLKFAYVNNINDIHNKNNIFINGYITRSKYLNNRSKKKYIPSRYYSFTTSPNQKQQLFNKSFTKNFILYYNPSIYANTNKINDLFNKIMSVVNLLHNHISNLNFDKNKNLFLKNFMSIDKFLYKQKGVNSNYSNLILSLNGKLNKKETKKVFTNSFEEINFNIVNMIFMFGIRNYEVNCKLFVFIYIFVCFL